MQTLRHISGGSILPAWAAQFLLLCVVLSGCDSTFVGRQVVMPAAALPSMKAAVALSYGNAGFAHKVLLNYSVSVVANHDVAMMWL